MDRQELFLERILINNTHPDPDRKIQACSRMHRYEFKGENLTSVFREADAEMHLGDFFLEEILLIEEQDNGGGCKIFMVTDAVEEMEALVHSVL